MGILEKLENLLNEGLEQSLAKAFAGRVHPVEIARKLELEATARKRVALIGELIPDEYLIELAPSDYAELEPIQAGLEEQLAEYVTEMADREGLFLLYSPRVTLAASEVLRLGQFKTRGNFSGKPPAYTLKLETGPGSGFVFSFEQEKVVVGRASGCEVKLDDQRVSRKHFEIRFDGSQFWVVDLGSTNGTYLGEERISKSALKPGDVIAAGVTSLRFDVPLWRKGDG